MFPSGPRIQVQAFTVSECIRSGLVWVKESSAKPVYRTGFNTSQPETLVRSEWVGSHSQGIKGPTDLLNGCEFATPDKYWPIKVSSSWPTGLSNQLKAIFFEHWWRNKLGPWCIQAHTFSSLFTSKFPKKGKKFFSWCDW